MLAEFFHVSGGEEEAVDVGLYGLGHAAEVGGDDGDAGGHGFVDDEGGVFVPERGADETGRWC